MPNRTTLDERDKLDHSSHPTSNATKDDLRPPGGANELKPPADEEDRVEDFFARHGGPGKAPRRAGQSQGGLAGWSEIEAGDGHVLRCDWSLSGTMENAKYIEVAPDAASINRMHQGT